MVKVYIAPEVAGVLSLHPYVAKPGYRSSSIREQIEQQARTLYRAFKASDPRCAMQIQSWWPSARGQNLGALMGTPFTQQDALLTVCREHGYPSAQVVEDHAKALVDQHFEAALDSMLSGDLIGLMARLDATPDLVHNRSSYGHRSTLLHYLSANGVESHRQCVPLNAADIAAALIDHGADTSATANMYGGGQTPLSLAETSAHPKSAGVAEELIRVLSGG